MHRDLRPVFHFPRWPRDTDYGLYRYILFKQTLTSRPRYFVLGEGMSNVLPAILVQCCCHSTLHRPEIIFIPTLSAALIFILRHVPTIPTSVPRIKKCELKGRNNGRMNFPFLPFCVLRDTLRFIQNISNKSPNSRGIYKFLELRVSCRNHDFLFLWQ